MKKYKTLIANCNSKKEYIAIITEIFSDKTVSHKKAKELIDELKIKFPNFKDSRDPVKNYTVDYLFTTEQVKKYFKILNRLDRICGDQYLGYDKLNPKSRPCQREIFIKRTIAKWFSNKYYKLVFENSTGLFLEETDNYYDPKEYKIEMFKYIATGNIRYSLRYSDELKISYTDAANGFNIDKPLEIKHNDALRLIGVEITKEKYDEINELFKY